MSPALEEAASLAETAALILRSAAVQPTAESVVREAFAHLASASAIVSAALPNEPKRRSRR